MCERLRKLTQTYDADQKCTYKIGDITVTVYFGTRELSTLL